MTCSEPLPMDQDPLLPELRNTLTTLAELIVRLAARRAPERLELSSEPRECPARSPAEPPNDYATVDQYAERRGVGRTTVFSWIRAGLPSVKQGATRRIPWREADAFLDSGRLSKAKPRGTKRT